jgi:hypothetical protein
MYVSRFLRNVNLAFALRIFLILIIKKNASCAIRFETYMYLFVFFVS